MTVPHRLTGSLTNIEPLELVRPDEVDWAHLDHHADIRATPDATPILHRLAATLQRTNRVLLARFMIHGRLHYGALRPVEGALRLDAAEWDVESMDELAADELQEVPQAPHPDLDLRPLLTFIETHSGDPA